jgi:hypothetical protein
MFSDHADLSLLRSWPLTPLIPRKAAQTGRLRRKPAIRDGLKAREKAPKVYDESPPCGVARLALWTTKKAMPDEFASSPHLYQFIVCRTIIAAIANGFSPCTIGRVQVQSLQFAHFLARRSFCLSSATLAVFL